MDKYTDLDAHEREYYGSMFVGPTGETQLDEYGYPIPVSCWHLYQFSPIQDCYIPRLRVMVMEFKDMPGEIVSVRYAQEHGYIWRHEYFSSQEAFEEYRHRQEVRKLEAQWRP